MKNRTLHISFAFLLVLVAGGPAVSYSQANAGQYGQHAASELKLDREYPVKVEVDLLQAGNYLLFDEKSVGRICGERLRAAKLPIAADSASGPSNSLFVNLALLKDTVNITLAFARLITTKVGNETFLRKSTVWTTNVSGLHNNSEYIVEEGLKGVVDQFVTSYRMANPRAGSAEAQPGPFRTP